MTNRVIFKETVGDILFNEQVGGYKEQQQGDIYEKWGSIYRNNRGKFMTNGVIFKKQKGNI